MQKEVNPSVLISVIIVAVVIVGVLIYKVAVPQSHVVLRTNGANMPGGNGGPPPHALQPVGKVQWQSGTSVGVASGVPAHH
jgi:hypothetical protein